MKRLFTLLFLISLLVASTTIFAESQKHLKKISKSYKCKHIGVQKVKSYHFRKIRHFGYLTIKIRGKYEIRKS